MPSLRSFGFHSARHGQAEPPHTTAESRVRWGSAVHTVLYEPTASWTCPLARAALLLGTMQSVLRSEQCQCQCCSPTPKYRDAGPCSFARVLPHPPTVDEMAASPRGFIGLGIMGRGMAHILAAKTPIVVWNRNRDKAESFAAEALAAGAKDVTVAATAEEVVAACGVTYSMLSDMPASEARPPAAAALRGGTALPSASASGRLLPLTSACSSLKPQASSLKS